MKKYTIVATGEPVNIGDTLQGKKEVSTSFGTMEMMEEILVTEAIIPSLIERGIIKAVEIKEEETPTVGKYIHGLAEKYKMSVSDTIEWIDKTNKICPKAVLDILLNEIAFDFYKKDAKAFSDTKEYYSLRSKDGKVGKVNGISSYIPLFKSVKDAEKAREILKEQLKHMYGKGC